MPRNVLWLGTSSGCDPCIPQEQRIPAIVTKRLKEGGGALIAVWRPGDASA